MPTRKKSAIQAQSGKDQTRRIPVAGPKLETSPNPKKDFKIIATSTKTPAPKNSRPTPKVESKQVGLKLNKSDYFAWRECLPRETLIGIADDYLDHHQILITTLLDELALGDRLHIRGKTTNVIQTVNSIQADHQAVKLGEIGQEVGIKVDQKVRKSDYIYRLLTER